MNTFSGAACCRLPLLFPLRPIGSVNAVFYSEMAAVAFLRCFPLQANIALSSLPLKEIS
jgi:hypothetical protein